MNIQEIREIVNNDGLVLYYHKGLHSDPLIVMPSQYGDKQLCLFDRAAWHPSASVQSIERPFYWSNISIDWDLFKVEHEIKLSEIDWR